MFVHRNLHDESTSAIVFAASKLASFHTKINFFSKGGGIFSDLAKGVSSFLMEMTDLSAAGGRAGQWVNESLKGQMHASGGRWEKLMAGNLWEHTKTNEEIVEKCTEFVHCIDARFCHVIEFEHPPGRANRFPKRLVLSEFEMMEEYY